MTTKVPWLTMVRSGQWWLMVLMNAAFGVGVLVSMPLIPLYTNDVLTTDPQMIAVISTIISSPAIIFTMPFSAGMDYMGTKTSLTTSRKAMLGFGLVFFVPAMVTAGYLGSDVTSVAVIVLTISSVSVTAIATGTCTSRTQYTVEPH